MEVVLGFIAVFVAIAVPLTIEWFRRPRLRLVVGKPSVDTYRQRKFVHVQVINEPLTTRWVKSWLMRNTAAGCIAFMSFEDLKTGERPLLNEEAKWSSTPEPLTYPPGANPPWVPDATKVARAYVLDVPPGKTGQALALALKYEGDDVFYAYNARSYAVNKLSNPDLAMVGHEYRVTVRVEAGGIEKRERFRIRNYGTSMDEFEITLDVP